MRILSICDERLDELARRKKAIHYRIAVQRAELEHELHRWRRPLQSFDRVREMGDRMREHGPALLMLLVPIVFLLRRPLIGGISLATRVMRGAMRWWTLWKIGSRFLAGMPGLLKR